MEQQTAIEWLVNNIWKGEPTLHQKVLIEQAKQMEKEQIMTAHYDGFRYHIGTTEISEQYYKDNYNK